MLAPMVPSEKTRTTRGADGTWKAPDFKGNKEHLMILRKAWEVGTESVVMQTVAQVDGDIVTRIQNDHADAAHQQVHDIHQQMVGESLQHWRFLFATVATFTLGVFRSFFD